MENKLDLEQFDGHTPKRFKDISSSPHLFGEFAPSDRRLLRAAPDLLAELKEARKEIEELRQRNKEGIDELNGIIASGYYGQMMTRLAYVRRKLEGKQ